MTRTVRVVKQRNGRLKLKRSRRPRLTLAVLLKRVVALERQMRQVSREANSAYIHTMRIGAQ